MVEKQKLSQHYEQILQKIDSFEQPELGFLQAYYSQLSARLNPESRKNPSESCPGCCISRTEENQEVVEESPVEKKQKKRVKAIQKLRKIKKKTKKQENMLKKLLMRKNGFQTIICKLCQYTIKKPCPQNNPTEQEKPTVPSNPPKQKPSQKRKPVQQTPEAISAKKQKKKTAGLNPLYVKPKISTQFESNSKSLNSAKNLQKLSQMLQNSDKQKKSRLELFLE